MLCLLRPIKIRSVPYYCALQKRETGIVHLPTAAKLSLACVRDRSLLDQWSADVAMRLAYGYLHFELDNCNYARFYAEGILDSDCSEDFHLFLVLPDTRPWCNNTKNRRLSSHVIFDMPTRQQCSTSARRTISPDSRIHYVASGFLQAWLVSRCLTARAARDRGRA